MRWVWLACFLFTVQKAPAAVMTMQDLTDEFHLVTSIGSAASGATMDGAQVLVRFFDGETEQATFNATSFNAGSAVGTGWSLGLVGNAFFNDFRLTNTTGRPITGFGIYGLAGGIVFDTGNSPSTPGSSLGNLFVARSPYSGYDIQVTYTAPAGLSDPALGDVFAGLIVEISNRNGTPPYPQGIASTPFDFRQDVDPATFADPQPFDVYFPFDLLEQIPEPGLLWLLIAGVVGLYFFRSQRHAATAFHHQNPQKDVKADRAAGGGL